ncbi:SCO family protein [Chloroflexus sp.]|uniref:SCO family protein n=1 Tax=Chloroflexus sp. TaxID=1904827 RepID=UPI00298EE3EC|nr:SCO family protein [Chloroflexus sp.]MCS6886990.1 SCO family protein [Chloroflexus sp.]MDW8403131.1 SCO family protein [Chloroflexus sp.]
MSRWFSFTLIGWLAVLLLAPATALAQGGKTNPADNVAFEQRIGEQVPLDAIFRDEQGAEVRLGQFFTTGQPVILVMSYYECPMLCSFVREGVLSALQQVTLTAGRDFQVVNISIDPLETPMMAAGVKTLTIQRYARAGAEQGWHFLTGSEEQIRRVADAIGFKYFYDETIDQYAHAAGIVVLTPEGKTARYFFGIEFNVSDVRLGIVEASAGKVGNPIDQLLLLCYQYNPATGSYTPAIMTILRIAGVLTVIGIITLIIVLSRSTPGGTLPPREAAPA